MHSLIMFINIAANVAVCGATLPQMWQCAEHAREQYHRPLRLRGGGSVFAGLQRDGRAGGFDVLFLGSGVSTGLYLSSYIQAYFISALLPISKRSHFFRRRTYVTP